MNQNYKQLFAILSKNLGGFIEEVKNKKLTLMATDEWTVKDILCHIVFWHETYAANYKALAQHSKLAIPELPAYKLNMPAVISLRRDTIEELINKLHKANKILYTSIVEKKVPRMTYNKGGRTYDTADFLDMVARHVNTHTKHVRGAR